MRVRIGWHPLFVCTPTQFGWRNTFFIETFHRPRVAELVGFFWNVADLGVALGNVNHFGASELCKHVELFCIQRRLQRTCATAGFAIKKQLVGDVDKRLFHQVADHARVCTVFEHCRRAIVGAPLGNHFADGLMADIKGALERMGLGNVVVRIPQFD